MPNQGNLGFRSVIISSALTDELVTELNSLRETLRLEIEGHIKTAPDNLLKADEWTEKHSSTLLACVSEERFGDGAEYSDAALIIFLPAEDFPETEASTYRMTLCFPESGTALDITQGCQVEFSIPSRVGAVAAVGDIVRAYMTPSLNAFDFADMKSVLKGKFCRCQRIIGSNEDDGTLLNVFKRALENVSDAYLIITANDDHRLWAQQLDFVQKCADLCENKLPGQFDVALTSSQDLGGVLAATLFSVRKGRDANALSAPPYRLSLKTLLAGVGAGTGPIFELNVKVGAVREEITRKGTRMAFVEVFDHTGKAELIVLPSCYEEFADLLVPGTVLKAICSTLVTQTENSSRENEVAIFIEHVQPSHWSDR